MNALVAETASSLPIDLASYAVLAVGILFVVAWVASVLR